MLDELLDLCDRGLGLDEDALFETVVNDQQFQTEVIEANKSQLYDEGIESDGTSMEITHREP